jgi:hypothetical protein
VEDGGVGARADDGVVAGAVAAALAEGVVDDGLELVLEGARAAEAHRGEVSLGGDRGCVAQGGEILGVLVETELV